MELDRQLRRRAVINSHLKGLHEHRFKLCDFLFKCIDLLFLLRTRGVLPVVDLQPSSGLGFRSVDTVFDRQQRELIKRDSFGLTINTRAKFFMDWCALLDHFSCGSSHCLRV